MLGKQQIADSYGISLRTLNRLCVEAGVWQKKDTKKLVSNVLVGKIKKIFGEGKMERKQTFIQKTNISVGTFRGCAKKILGEKHKAQYLTPIQVQDIKNHLGIYE